MTKPLVSVIIPTFNRQDLVLRAINSVLNQTEKNLELIVINDGSTDNTRQVLDKLAYKREKLQVIHQPHQGHAAARNLGLENSRGKYIAFLDDDDSWLSNKLKKQLKLFQTSPYKAKLGIVYCFHYWINQQGKRTGKLDIANRGDVFAKLIKGNIITGSGSAVITKKSCLDHVGGFNQHLTAGVDWEMWLRLAKNFYVDYVPEYLVNITDSQTSVTKNHLNLLKNHLLIYWQIIKHTKLGSQKLSPSTLVKALLFRLYKDLQTIWIKVIFKSYYRPAQPPG